MTTMMFRRTAPCPAALIAALLVVAFSSATPAAQDAPARGGQLTGRVVALADGDTLTLLTGERQQVRVRLAEIDTPERRQPYGTRAREQLSELVFGREVRVMGLIQHLCHKPPLGGVGLPGESMKREVNAALS